MGTGVERGRSGGVWEAARRALPVAQLGARRARGARAPFK